MEISLFRKFRNYGFLSSKSIPKKNWSSPPFVILKAFVLQDMLCVCVYVFPGSESVRVCRTGAAPGLL